MSPRRPVLLRTDLGWGAALTAGALLSIPGIYAPWGLLGLVVMPFMGYLAGRWTRSLVTANAAFGVAAIVTLGAATAAEGSDALGDWLTMLLLILVLTLIPWWIGRFRLLRIEQGERERAAIVQQARLRERTRIANDMHDSVGHELALIALRSGALEVSADITDRQREHMAELRASAVRATQRLHDIIQVLRDGESAALHPGDESIDDLVRRAADAGMRVRLRREGDPAPWSPMTAHAVHRVVQEALTNATKHAAGADVTVTVQRRPDSSRITVDNGPGPTGALGRPGRGSGQGLISLHERVRLVGGTVRAGPRPDGGFALVADIPDHESTARPPATDDSSSTSSGPSVTVSAEGGRRTVRRRMATAAILPGAVAAVFLSILIVAHVATFTDTALPPERFRQLELGQSRSQIDQLLPPHSVSTPPPTLRIPPPPANTSCEYYQAWSNPFDLSPEMYRLCFDGNTLVAADLLEGR